MMRHQYPASRTREWVVVAVVVASSPLHSSQTKRKPSDGDDDHVEDSENLVYQIQLVGGDYWMGLEREDRVLMKSLLLPIVRTWI
jgi:hypothetical protein